MAAEPKQWTWQEFVQLLLDLHEDVLNKVTEYWDHNDLLTLEEVDSKQKLRTLISDAFKRLKSVDLDVAIPANIKVLERCGEGLKTVQCSYHQVKHGEPSKQVDEVISIYAETLARQSPNLVHIYYGLHLDYRHLLRLILDYISQLQGHCKLRTAQMDFGYEHNPEQAEMENQILNGCDSIEDVYLNTYDAKVIGNVRQYLEKHGDHIKQLKISIIKSALEVAVEFSSYLKSGCRLFVKEYGSDSYGSTMLKQHLSILQNRTDLDCYVHIRICHDSDPLPFDIIKSIYWNKKWDYQKLAASKGIERFEQNTCDEDLFLFLLNAESLPKLKHLFVKRCPTSKEFRAFLKARGHSIKLSGYIQSEEHIEDLTAISNHLKQSRFYVELVVTEKQENYEIPLSLLKKLASNSNRRIILRIDQELFDRYEQLYSMLTKQEQAVLQLQKTLFYAF